MKKTIKKEDIIEKVIKDFPQTIEVFWEFGLFCVGCPANKYETIDQGAKVHGKKDKEIEKLIEKLNLALKTT